jgi:hypothetical protein
MSLPQVRRISTYARSPGLFGVLPVGNGTVAILASYGVTSITDNAVGDRTVNFTSIFQRKL